MRRNVLNSPRLLGLKRKRRRVLLNKFLLFFVALLGLITLLVFLARVQKSNIQTIVTEGNQVVDGDEMAEVVWAHLSGKYFWLFPKTNIFFYPKGNIEAALVEKFTRLEDISLSVEKNQVLKIKVTERGGTYIWCGEAPKGDVNSEKCYFMDSNGYIFDDAPYFSQGAYFKFYGLTHLPDKENETTQSPLGNYFEELELNELINFKDNLESLGMKVMSIYIAKDGDGTAYLRPQNSQSTFPKITFKIDADLDKIIENLQSALTNEPLLTEFKNKYGALEYIDLRFGNKVYYKFR